MRTREENAQGKMMSASQKGNLGFCGAPALQPSSAAAKSNFWSLTTMSAQTPDPPRRVFGAPAADSSPIDDGAGTPTSERRGLGFGRVSFSQRKPSFISRWRRVPDEENGTGAGALAGEILERPLIPSALEQKGEPHTTPLPKLSMIVLSIVRAFSLKLYTWQIPYWMLHRRCWASFCRQMCLRRSCCSWLKVRHNAPPLGPAVPTLTHDGRL